MTRPAKQMLSQLQLRLLVTDNSAVVHERMAAKGMMIGEVRRVIVFCLPMKTLAAQQFVYQEQ